MALCQNRRGKARHMRLSAYGIKQKTASYLIIFLYQGFSSSRQAPICSRIMLREVSNMYLEHEMRKRQCCSASTRNETNNKEKEHNIMQTPPGPHQNEYRGTYPVQN